MAITLPPPTSQKSRLVSFRLDGSAIGYAPAWFHLPIRPEDLTREEPSRATVHQTLSTQSVVGWVDSFGAGLPTVVIAGHTGWHRAQATGWDGEEAFRQLHQQIFDNWHQYRQEAINAGKDPDVIKLVFVDELNGYAYQVVPLVFTLRRSRGRPLLLQYNIRMQATSLLPEVPQQASQPQADARKGLTSLQSTIAKIEGAVASVTSTLNSYVAIVAAPVHEFMNLTSTVLSAAQSVESSILSGVASVSDNLIGVAQDIAQSGRNIFWTINGIENLPDEVKFQLEDVASAYSNAFCVFGNSLQRRKVYPQFNPLYGASNCSSTTGGLPLSQYSETGVNPFIDVTPPPGGVKISSAASSAISALKSADPVLHPMSTDELAALTQNVSSGISGIA